MSDDIDDSVVHHDDFTLSTEWEKFVDRLEKVIFKWRLSENKFTHPLCADDYLNGSWETTTEPVDFADFKFDIRKYCLKVRGDEEDEKCTPVSPISEEDAPNDGSPKAYENHLDLNSASNIFLPMKEVGSPDMHCIIRWYGLREFLVLSPQPRHSIASESRLKILLSSVLIAVNNCSCSVPVFVQFHHPSSHYFVGVAEGSEGIRVDFEMAHLNSPPPGSHLSGLLDMFKYKIRDPSALKGPVQVSAQFTYRLKNQFPGYEHPSEVYHIEKLPFKMYSQNMWEIHLMATWPQLPEDAVVDRVGSSSFHPLSAPSWSVRMPLLSLPYRILKPNRSPSNTQIGDYPSLAKYLMECISCTRISRAHDSILDTSIVKLIGGVEPESDDTGLPAKAALDILTNSKVSGFTKVVNNATKSRLQKIWHGNKASLTSASGQSKKSDLAEEGPIPDDTLLAILHYLFPDADETHECCYPDAFTQGANGSGDSNMTKTKKLKPKKGCPWLGRLLKVGSLLKSVDPKTCQKESLVWRLTLALAFVHQTLGGPMAVAHLWYEVAQEARYRWDKLIPLPGLIAGEPDHKTSLLNQKFQMLNCCIDRRKRENEVRKNPPSHSSSFNLDSEASEDEDESFYDCPEDLPEDEEDDSKEETDSKVRVPRMKYSLWNRPEGRLKVMEGVCVLSTGEPLYMPITQEIPPKTEDQLEEDAELMLMLGNDALGAELRASIMSASLLSDMESFKAANPNAELIDFIRWYSPRDWVEEEVLNEFGQKKGHLSERMLLPGNKWQEVWSAAKPVPARRQKRLFNEGCEAEKVLHFLETLTVSKVFRNVMPILLQQALCRIGEEMEMLEAPEEEIESAGDENVDEALEADPSKESKVQDKCDIEFFEGKNFSEKVLEEPKPEDIILPHYVPQNLKRIVNRVRNISLNPMGVDPGFYMDLIFEIGKIESLVSMARGLQRQFNLEREKLKTKDYFSFIKSLANEEEANIEGGRQSLLGELIWNFIQKERTMEGRLLDEHFHAERKEYVLQVVATRPTPYSRPTPQRLTAVIKEGEFRLAGAFSQDTVFF